MAYALISPNEPVYNYLLPPSQIGVRIAEVAFATFDVASPLFWEPCDNNVVANEWYWNGSTCVKKPTLPDPIIPLVVNPATEAAAAAVTQGGPTIVAQ